MYTLVPFRNNRSDLSGLLSDRFFRSFFDMNDAFATAGFRVDVKEDESAYHLEAELPGVSRDNIQLNVEDGALCISADLNEQKKEEKGNYLYSERRSGHVERRFELEGIDEGGIAADYRDGVLTVTLPKMKAEEKKSARAIAIGDGSDK